MLDDSAFAQKAHVPQRGDQERMTNGMRRVPVGCQGADQPTSIGDWGTTNARAFGTTWWQLH